MRTKVIDLELSEGLSPIWGMKGYEGAYVLVRYQGRPVGWVNCPRLGQSIISTAQLSEAINQRLGRRLVLAFLGKQSDTRVSDMPALPPISIVVCIRERTVQGERCLRMLLALEYTDYEIIVVDYAPSRDNTTNISAGMSVRYVRDQDSSLPCARNRGIAEARHDIIAFIGEDSCPDRYWLRSIGSAFTLPEVMAVTGLVAPAELETVAQTWCEYGGYGMGRGLRRRILRRDLLTNKDLLWANNFGTGTNMAFRRKVLTAIGHFDTVFGECNTADGSDIEMLHRLIAGGHTIIYEPSALVWYTPCRSAVSLRRLSYDYGISFGIYLLTCAHNRTVSRLSLLHFLFLEWLKRRVLCRLWRPKGHPCRLAACELHGMIRSLFVYLKAQRHVRKVTADHNTSVGPDTQNTNASSAELETSWEEVTEKNATVMALGPE